MSRKPTDIIQLKLRFPESLRRPLERAAARNNRSMNREIVHRVEQSFSAADLEEMVRTAVRDEIMKRTAKLEGDDI